MALIVGFGEKIERWTRIEKKKLNLVKEFKFYADKSTATLAIIFKLPTIKIVHKLTGM